jgi:hypothetical protein
VATNLGEFDDRGSPELAIVSDILVWEEKSPPLASSQMAYKRLKNK